MSQLDRVWRQSRLSNTTKFRIYNLCVLSSLLYASETWTLLKADIAKLEGFHMTNQRRILGILWYEFVANVEVATLSHLPSINEAISLRSHSLFGHVRHMDQAVLAHQTLHLSVTSRQGSGEFDIWRRQPGHPRKCWVEQVTTSTGLSPSDAWSVVTIGQHGGRYDPSTVKCREREREKERERNAHDITACYTIHGDSEKNNTKCDI